MSDQHYEQGSNKDNIQIVILNQGHVDGLRTKSIRWTCEINCLACPSKCSDTELGGKVHVFEQFFSWWEGLLGQHLCYSFRVLSISEKNMKVGYFQVTNSLWIIDQFLERFNHFFVISDFELAEHLSDRCSNSETETFLTLPILLCSIIAEFRCWSPNIGMRIAENGGAWMSKKEPWTYLVFLSTQVLAQSPCHHE